jgi:octaprenyl-diphosphate synthase
LNKLVLKKIEYFVNDLNSSKSLLLLSKLQEGKMLRSKLITKITGIDDKSITLCAIIEMIHLASLLHDDVLDNALTRRGSQTINHIFDNKTAIMFGDLLYSKAFFELSNFTQDMSAIVSNAVVNLSLGEIMDIDLADKFNTDTNLFMDMLYKKTASLIEASAKCAAILANKDIEKYSIYGRNLGISFQLVDDILDIESTSKQLGKPAFSDYKEGKVTLPYIYAYKALNENDKQKFKSMHKIELCVEDENWIKSKLNETGAITDVKNLINQKSSLALKAIESENNNSLVDIIKQVTMRIY